MGFNFGSVKFVSVADKLAIMTLCIAGLLTSGTVAAQTVNLQLTKRDAEVTLDYTRIKSVDDLKHNIDQARTKQKYVMLIIYADWDIYSKRYEKEVFTHPEVLNRLSSVSRLHADVSHNNEQDKSLLKYLNVVGPPTILFWDTNGAEQREHRIYGFKNYKEFIAHINKVIKGH